ncbi:SbcC/MukB-like Walker B domain-containing protein [Sphaerisporangium fuscum]|uniref:SbcC/MukB-like Walker B domain-containing protein n=1 Tax=Sphaerisporangium fuscum TaxID=2835868 RepID=UPI001BDD4EF3|nr:SbcC/MukB-like Walker B domain-containing protein [Sphaerisporangium fuscum]
MTPAPGRFKPSRAGVINIWDYSDEEFVFADGRLVLRGHNGSGKTKALEVLFPFVLDGVSDARRLDPFSGENRTMKSNLLYRGEEAGYGYVWMEFVRDGVPGATASTEIHGEDHGHPSTQNGELNGADRGVPAEDGELGGADRGVPAEGSEPGGAGRALPGAADRAPRAQGAELGGVGRDLRARNGEPGGVHRDLNVNDGEPSPEAGDGHDAPGEVGREEPEAVTLIIGLRAHRHRDGVTSSFFVTAKRVGVDFGLLSADSRPLTEKQLKAVLEPGARFKTATDYRAAVDARLFGLGKERYAQLLDLLLALRRPLLAKDLDPVKVSDTLSAGLSPVDPVLVEQAARDFENLAAVQRLFDDLSLADGAVKEFLVHYTAYLRAHIRHQIDRIAERVEGAAGSADRIRQAAAELRRAQSAREEAKQHQEAAETELDRYDGRLAVLKQHDAYKAAGELDGLRRRIADESAAIARERKRLDQGRGHITKLGAEAAKVTERLEDARAKADRHLNELADAAGRAGVAEGGEILGATAEEGVTLARARVTARRGDVEAVRARIAELAATEAKRARAETAVDDADRAVTTGEAKLSQAEDGLGQARRSTLEALEQWARRWIMAGEHAVLTDGDLVVMTETLETAGEPGARSLPEVFGELTEERLAQVIETKARVEAEDSRVGALVRELRAARKAVAAERDDAPPGDEARETAREGRPGAPLWRLVRFADDVGDGTAAGVEGALYGAGLLTAWIHPDPGLTTAALEAGEADGYLVALPEERRPRGRTLADVLVAEDQEMVASSVVEAVLRSVALDDDVTGAVHASPVVSEDARFGYGPHLGALPKPSAEYIGATNRATRRRLRIAEYDRLIAGHEETREALTEETERLNALVADFRRARKELPETKAIVTAARAVADQASRLAVARSALETARKSLDVVVAEVGAAGRRLRQTAAELSMPRDPREVDAVAQALDDVLRAAEALRTEREKAATAESDLADRQETIGRLTEEQAEGEMVLGERQAAHAVLVERLETLERTFDADLKEVLQQISETERLIAQARRARYDQEKIAAKEREAEVVAGKDLEHGRESLTAAFASLSEQIAEFVPYTQADLRPLAGVADLSPWPLQDDPHGPEQAGKIVADLMIAETPPDPLEAVRSTLPAGALAIIDAYDAATQGGRAVTPSTLKTTLDRLSNALRDFQAALEKCQEDYRLDWEPGAVLTVHVIDADGRAPVSAFARNVAERAEEQGVLLEERERTVLEDELLTGLAQQIHSRVLAAKDLVRGMNADTRSKPMSSGTTIGIRWVQSDKIDDRQRAVAALLVRDAAALGRQGLTVLRGHLRQMIRDYRGRNSRATYKEALGAVLDYRSWYTFELLMARRGEPEARLTRAKHSQMSGGEKSASIHLPLFAAANALYSSGRASCPRMIALDEAFAGIDDNYKPELLGLTVQFDLDLFMTGHDLWCTYPTMPMIAHYDLLHDSELRTVSTILALWDGAQVFDADAGYSGNDELVRELLGFTPRRHLPPGTLPDTLLTSPDDDDDLEELEIPM